MVPWKLRRASQDSYLECAKSGKAKVLEGLLKGFDEEGLKKIRDDSRDGNSILSTAAFYGHVECCKVIMEKCPSLLHDINKEECTALHHAASENRTDILRYLLRLEAAAKNDDVEGKKKLLTMIDKEGCTALHSAARRGHTGAVNVLIEADNEGDLLRATDSQHRTALHLAAQNGHVKTVEELIKAANKHGVRLLTMKDREDHTALHLAAQNGDVMTVEELIKADQYGELLTMTDNETHRVQLLTMKDREDRTALHLAAQSGHENVVILLTEAKHGVQLLTMKDREDRTALHLAAQSGHEKVVNLLTEANEDGVRLLMMNDREDRTALHLAAQSGHVGPLQVLIKADVDGILLSMVDKNEDTAMHLAVEMQKEIVEILAIEKPDLEYSANKSGQTPHFIAFEKAVSGVPTAEAIKKIILQLPERVNKHGQNFLHILSSTSKHDEEKYSLGLKDIDPIILNKQDQKGDTPLHIAVENANENLAKALLYNKDVDKTIKNYDGHMAVDMITFQYDSKKAGTFGLAKADQNLAIAELFQSQVRAEIYKIQVKDQADIDLVVATLIATVSFAAGIAVPGGYTGEGSNIGTAILSPKTSFKVFMVSDAIALLLSLHAVLSHLAVKHIRVEELMLYQVKIARRCSILAIFAMEAAFASGVYAVLAVSDEFALILCALVSSIGLLGLLPLFRIRGSIWENIIKLYDYVKNLYRRSPRSSKRAAT